MAVGGVSNLQGTIKGTFSKPVIRLNTAAAAKQAAVSLADKAFKSTLGTNTAETAAKVNAELDKKAEEMRAAAKAAGDKLIEEADTQGNNLIDKASNPFVKAAAKATAAQLKKEAQKKATSLLADVEVRIKTMATSAKSN